MNMIVGLFGNFDGSVCVVLFRFLDVNVGKILLVVVDFLVSVRIRVSVNCMIIFFECYMGCG